MMEVIDFFENIPLFLTIHDNTSSENVARRKIRILKNNLRYYASLIIDEKNYIRYSDTNSDTINLVLVDTNYESNIQIETKSKIKTKSTEILTKMFKKYPYMEVIISGKFADTEIKLEIDYEFFDEIIGFFNYGIVQIDNIEKQNPEKFIKLYEFADKYCLDDLVKLTEKALEIFECIEDGTKDMDLCKKY
jgi:hypothetical protein